MSTASDEEKKLLAHHVQLPLCTTRLPYRQGRKLTAVKVYTINNESNHLLVFGVPSLNLRQETKALFIKFGKLLHFTISTNHPAEDFTDTYHARYERIQSARIAKRMIDTKNFYGGSLHVCYAPEFESLEETRSKLLQRQKDVQYRLINLQKQTETRQASSETTVDSKNNNFQNHENVSIVNEIHCSTSKDESNRNEHKFMSKKMNMGEENVIYFNKQKRKANKEVVIEKRFKPCFEENKKVPTTNDEQEKIEVIDCTSIEKEIVSNINEALNYNKFGNEIIRKVEAKPLNRIIFNCNKKT